MLYSKLPMIDNIHEIIIGSLYVLLIIDLVIISEITLPIDVNDITKKATFRCGVYERTETGIGDYIGAAALTLTNKDAP